MKTLAIKIPGRKTANYCSFLKKYPIFKNHIYSFKELPKVAVQLKNITQVEVQTEMASDRTGQDKSDVL